MDNKHNSRKITGDNGEDAVLSYMQNQGYRLIIRNFEVHNVGELDLVFEKDEDIYIVEVRSRRNEGIYPSSAETVDFKKRKKIMSATRFLIAKYNYYDRNVHFLIGQVTHNRQGLVQNVEIIPF